jgi:hypothetical protein
VHAGSHFVAEKGEKAGHFGARVRKIPAISHFAIHVSA